MHSELSRYEASWWGVDTVATRPARLGWALTGWAIWAAAIERRAGWLFHGTSWSVNMESNAGRENKRVSSPVPPVFAAYCSTNNLALVLPPQYAE
jgi:hypothetical protein